MSNRTSKANKAVRGAWENERELVLNGKGKRNWTPEQQRSIVEKGIAFDETGKAFEGHHMKSVEAYPEYQGDYKNIQFLSRDEHQKAHFGNFRNPTNGYYMYKTGKTRDFGDGKYRACRTIYLSEPIYLKSVQNDTNVKTDKEVNVSKDKLPNNNIRKKETAIKRAGIKAAKAGIAIVDFMNKNPEIKNLVKETARVVFADYIGPTIVSTHRTNSQKRISNTEAIAHNASIIDRASPIEHNVSAYTRIQNGKKVNVKSYKRGGNKSEK